MKQLLVCTDGSSYGVEACKYASWLAGRTGAGITALYVSDLRQFEIPIVADLSGSLGVQPYQGMTTHLQEMEQERARLIGEKTREIFDQQGVGDTAQFEHRTGLVVDTISEMQEDFDVVIIGKRGENANFDTEHLGSMMERIIRASKKPTWVTSRAFREIERVIFAYDGGPSCRKALEFLMVSRALKGLDMHVVSVAERGESEFLRDGLVEVEQKLRNNGYAPTCQMLTGEPEAAISSYVVAQKMDMLLMGAYGHGRIRYLLIGSTTTEMIRRCQIPVLTFR